MGEEKKNNNEEKEKIVILKEGAKKDKKKGCFNCFVTVGMGTTYSCGDVHPTIVGLYMALFRER